MQHCPMYVEFVRECQYKIGFLPLDTYEYCSSVEYEKCPFYRSINRIGYICKYLMACMAFEHFKADNFEQFSSIADNYCLSETNCQNCERFKLRKKGKIPPENLMPDGSLFDK